MKSINLLVLSTMILSISLVSCSKENNDLTTTETEEFTPSEVVFDSVNSYSFSFSKSYENVLNAIGGSSGQGTNLSSEPDGNQIKWTMNAHLEDGSTVVDQTLIFYSDNTDAGTYPVAEYHLVSNNDDEVHWLTPDMTGDIIVTSLSDTLVNGTVLLERIDGDTTFTLSGGLHDIIIL